VSDVLAQHELSTDESPRRKERNQYIPVAVEFHLEIAKTKQDSGDPKRQNPASRVPTGTYNFSNATT
jgi:hypothetical protein